MFGRLAVLVLVGVLGVPGTAAALGAGSFPTPCEDLRHDCGDFVLKSCCCDSGQSNHSLPATPPVDRTASSAVAAACVAPAVAALPPANTDISLAALRLHSPPHGYRSIDLSVLFSVFLI